MILNTRSTSGASATSMDGTSCWPSSTDSDLSAWITVLLCLTSAAHRIRCGTSGSTSAGTTATPEPRMLAYTRNTEKLSSSSRCVIESTSSCTLWRSYPVMRICSVTLAVSRLWTRRASSAVAALLFSPTSHVLTSALPPALDAASLYLAFSSSVDGRRLSRHDCSRLCTYRNTYDVSTLGFLTSPSATRLSASASTSVDLEFSCSRNLRTSDAMMAWMLGFGRNVTLRASSSSAS
uniref:Uncharacterized protein n=1 Tax=Globisporangium ultimum (strain ATCC 200006 / CBS 805.95 / DAOM BR144) TaxID=431595 RepID=K3WHG3_GLOUD